MPKQVKRSAEEIKAERIKKSEEKRKKREEYVKRKEKVMELEKANREYLYIFRTDDDKWWKLGWTSALVYYHIVASRIKKSPQLLADRDFRPKSLVGVVSVRDDTMKELDQKLKEIKVYEDRTNPAKEDGLKVYKLWYKLTLEDLRRLRKLEEGKRERLNTLAPVKIMMPDVAAPLRELLMKTKTVISKMPEYERQIAGYEISKCIVEASARYRSMVWGGQKPEVELAAIRQQMGRMLIMVNVAADMGIMGLDDGLWMGAKIGELRMLIDVKMGVKMPETGEILKQRLKK